MTIDYQSIIDTAGNIMLISFPIALVFYISRTIVGIFLDFVFGKEVSF